MRDQAREARFITALARIVKASRQEVDEATIEVYTEALCYDVAPDEWDAFTRHAVRAGRFGRWFPALIDVQDALREYRGARALPAEAEEAYERVMRTNTYTAEAGAVWSFREIRDRCGAACAEAFMAAGGHNAFATTWEESKRRARFIEAYAAAVRETPAAGLLPAGPEQRQLAAGDPRISANEAATILDRVRALAGALAPPPEIPKRESLVVVCDDAARARLAQQKARIAQLQEPEAVKSVGRPGNATPWPD